MICYIKEQWEDYIYKNNIKAIKYLLDNNLIDINIQNEYNNTPLIFVSYYNKIEILKLLLSYKDVNINYQTKFKDTALILVSCWNKIEIVKLLLNHPDINIFLKNEYGKIALYYANNKEIFNLLVNHDRKEKLKLLKHV
jgi:ankyrin repeat protein